jgi:hypothetical protein
MSRSKSKAKTNTFEFVRGLFAQKPKDQPAELRIEQRKADEGVLDRLASTNLAIAEHFAPLAVATHDPDLMNAVLGASREARACVEARKEVTGGGLAGGTQTEQGVTIRIEHSVNGQDIPDDFHAMKTDEPSFSIQTGSSPTK